MSVISKNEKLHIYFLISFQTSVCDIISISSKFSNFNLQDLQIYSFYVNCLNPQSYLNSMDMNYGYPSPGLRIRVTASPGPAELPVPRTGPSNSAGAGPRVTPAALPGRRGASRLNTQGRNLNDSRRRGGGSLARGSAAGVWPLSLRLEQRPGPHRPASRLARPGPRPAGTS